MSSPVPTHAEIVGSPDPIQYGGDHGSPARSSHRHDDLAEQQSLLSIGERFGRRHGQEWPTSNDRCASCLRSRPSRSKSHDRRTSGIVHLYAIPSKPVMGPQVFQAARKSEEEIRAIKNKQLRRYYHSLNELLDSFAEVEAILKEHREEELARASMLTQTPPPHTQQESWLSVPTNNTSNHNQNHHLISSYGSVSDQVARSDCHATLDVPSCSSGGIIVHVPTKDLEEPVQHRNDVHDNGPEESTPLIEYKRKKITSPRLVTLAINVSFLVNIVLVLLKIYTVLLSDSLAVMASMIDSLMDLLSGAIIWNSARHRSNTSDGHHYPVGKARMEPLGIIVFASVMVTSFMQVMLQSFQRLLEGAGEAPVDLGAVILALLALNILIKFGLWLWCRTMNDSSSVQALAQDHLNDVVFNIFSTFFPVAGQFLGFWWLDAVGAIALSIYIISEWTGTCLHNIRRLTGQVATPADIQQLTYMTYRFSNLIQVIDTVRAYYVGDGLFVEIDIVLPPDTPLSQAHDLGESLQIALEKLDSVERAFVHIDYNAVHAIEHR